MFTTCRSVKDTLESSLFEAQQRLSHLEITKSQLEIQLHTVVQAKEVIQGESSRTLHLVCICSAMLRNEGNAERALLH